MPKLKETPKKTSNKVTTQSKQREAKKSNSKQGKTSYKEEERSSKANTGDNRSRLAKQPKEEDKTVIIDKNDRKKTHEPKGKACN